MGWHATSFEGVVIGGGMVGASGLLLELLRGRRERRARFLAERREAYARLLGAADRALRIHTGVLNMDDSLQHMKARETELMTELATFGDDPQLAAALSGWQVDPTREVTNNLRVAFELAGPHLSDARNDRLRALLEEARRIADEIHALLAANDGHLAAFVAATDALNEAYTQVELCAGQKIRAAASDLRMAVGESKIDRPTAIRSIAGAREAFAKAARRDLGAPR